MKTLLDLYFAYVAQFIYNRATYMIMINSLQMYEFVCMYNARFLLYRNNTGTIHTYMYNLQIVIYRDTSPLHGHLVTKYLQIFKIQGFGYFQEDDIQLPGFYTNIPPSEFETSAPHQTQTGTPSKGRGGRGPLGINSDFCPGILSSVWNYCHPDGCCVRLQNQIIIIFF